VPTFHAGNRGSNPLGDAIYIEMAVRLPEGLFYAILEAQKDNLHSQYLDDIIAA
jgi:hypothetical protein